jgi:methionyl-tRNA synthetase
MAKKSKSKRKVAKKRSEAAPAKKPTKMTGKAGAKSSAPRASKAKATPSEKTPKAAAKSSVMSTPGTKKSAPNAGKGERTTKAAFNAETLPPTNVAPPALATAAKPAATKPAVPKAPPAVRRRAASPAAGEGADKPRFYITTAISYPNGVPHIGHAYEGIATDAIARFMRLDGYDVFFLTGTDEHGIKMHQTAGKEGLSARELVERNVPRFQEMVKRLNLSNDEFIRTTEDRHHRASIGIWDKMAENGDIYLDKYSGWYSVRDEAYYDETETKLNEQGVRVGPQGTPVEWVEEESYFFKLSAYQDKLLELYQRPDYVLPKERLNEVVSFVKGGLQDLSISRTTFDWGVKVPRDPKHVMYVWVDALTNYITAVGYPDVDSAKFKRYWPADLHVIGKDIVRFHAVYWPAFLMSAGVEVPRRIFSHGFLFNRGEKMSKSVGNVIDPFALCDAYGVDQVRYFFLREVPFGQDGTYSHEAIVNRINADLANDLGNLAQRSLTMVARRFNSELPRPGLFSPEDEAMLSAADSMIERARHSMKTQQLHHVLTYVWTVVAHANQYFTEQEPWALAKTDPVRQGTVLYVTAEVVRQVAILTQPFIPESAGKLLDQIGVPKAEREFSLLGGRHRISTGRPLPTPVPVFPRYVEPEASVTK